MSDEQAWFSDSRLFFLLVWKKKPMHVSSVSTHAWNISSKFLKLMNPQASPMNMLGFIIIQLFVQKIKALARNVRILYSCVGFGLDPGSKTWRLLHFLCEYRQENDFFSKYRG